jgi:hypothetical protein
MLSWLICFSRLGRAAARYLHRQPLDLASGPVAEPEAQPM